MKAAVYYETGHPDVFRYEEVPDPVCQPGGMLIDVKAVSIEGGDVLNRWHGEMPAKPHVVGYQCAGIIREVGSQVTDRSAGQAVVAMMPHGSHASLVSVAATQTWLVPDGMDIQQAACVPIPFGTADDCLFEFGRLQAGETVLVHGAAGGVGFAAIQLAKRAGATVIGTASSDERLERLKEYGLDHGINYRNEEFVARARALSGGQGVHLAVDGVGGKTLEGSINATGYRGRISRYGNVGRDFDPPDTSALGGMNRSLTGYSMAIETFRDPPRVRAMVEGHLRDVANGSLKVVIDRTFPLAEAAAAHGYIENQHAFGRVVLLP